jgi:hypothetical protein
MSTKRVKFDKKKKVKKYDRDEYSDSDSQGGNNSDDETKNKKFHSLDSDEEDDTDKYELLNREFMNG